MRCKEEQWPLSEPEVSGTFKVAGGELRAPSLGLNVRDLSLAGGVSGPRMWLDSLGATVGDGRLKASGRALLAFGDSATVFDSLEVVLLGDRVSAALARRFEVRADAELRAVFAGRALNYEGRISVPESRLYLPGLSTKFSASRRAAGRPMLVQATVPFDSASLCEARQCQG